MRTSEKKMQIVINNYFKQECDVNTSIREAFEKGFRIGVKKGQSAQPEPHEGHWIGGDGSYICSECNGSPMDFIDTMGASFDAYIETPMNYCPNCGAYMYDGGKDA